MASWLQHHYVKDDTAGGRALLTYSLWEQRTKLMRGAISLQQLWALHLDIVPGVGVVRIDYIIEACFKTPASLAAAYAMVPSKKDGKMLLARITPAPGGYHIGKKVFKYLYDLFTAKEYADHESGVVKIQDDGWVVGWGVVVRVDVRRRTNGSGCPIKGNMYFFLFLCTRHPALTGSPFSTALTKDFPLLPFSSS